MLSAKAFAAASSLRPPQEAGFFAALHLPNGTSKRTADHRMDDVNAFVAAQWNEAGFRPAQLLDVGVSSGISSLEWLEFLSTCGFDVRLTATDLTMWGDIISLYPGFDVLEARGVVLQHIIFGVALRPWRRRSDYLTGYALLSWIANGIAVHRLRSKRNAREAAATRIALLSKRVLGHPAITWAEDDVLAPNPKKFVRMFDAIRVANVLNRGYFNNEEIHRAVVNLKQRLVGPGACLIINQTLTHGGNHATLFRLTDADRFAVQARFGRGSAIEAVVLAA